MDTSRIRLLRPCTDYRGWWLSSYSVVDVDCSVAASMCAAGTAEDATDADLRLDTRIPLTEDRVRIAHVFNSVAHLAIDEHILHQEELHQLRLL